MYKGIVRRRLQVINKINNFCVFHFSKKKNKENFKDSEYFVLFLFFFFRFFSFRIEPLSNLITNPCFTLFYSVENIKICKCSDYLGTNERLKFEFGGDFSPEASLKWLKQKFWNLFFFFFNFASCQLLKHPGKKNDMKVKKRETLDSQSSKYSNILLCILKISSLAQPLKKQRT